MDINFVLVIGLTLIFSGFLKGFSGFGMSLVLAGISLTFYDPKFIIPVLAFLSITLNILLIIEHKGSIAKAKSNFAFKPETLVSLIIGTAIGTFLLVYLNPIAIKLFLGIMIILFILLLIKKIKIKKRIKVPLFWKHIVIGNVTGFFSGMLNINGPPVAVYNLYNNHKKKSFINSIIVFLTLADAFAIITYLLKDLISIQSLLIYLQFLPLLLLGFLIGRIIRRRVDDTKFRKYILILLFGVSIKLIIEGVNVFF